MSHTSRHGPAVNSRSVLDRDVVPRSIESGMNLVAMKSGLGEIRMGWIKLTDPQGHPVYLSPEQIVRIRPCIAGAGDPASARSVVDLPLPTLPRKRGEGREGASGNSRRDHRAHQ